MSLIIIYIIRSYNNKSSGANVCCPIPLCSIVGIVAFVSLQSKARSPHFSAVESHLPHPFPAVLQHYYIIMWSHDCSEILSMLEQDMLGCTESEVQWIV